METGNFTKSFNSCCIALFLVSLFTSCQDREIPLETTSDVLISTYIENDTSLSSFYSILDTTRFDGFLNAYGNYTCFAPNNRAVAQYASDHGKTSWKEFSMDELKKIVSLHVINGYFKSSSFSDGKMAKATMAGEYLTSSVSVDANNMANIIISADNLTKAKLMKMNIELGNGILHVIDKVLSPTNMNMAEIIESMRTRGFSIFADAMTETGLMDTLSKVNIGNSDTSRRWFTVLAEPDAVFNANGINNYADLKAKYSTKGNPKDPTDSLYIFMAYRILYGLNFLADFARNDTSVSGKDSYPTVISGEKTLVKRIVNSENIAVVLERDMYMKIINSVNFDRNVCDIKATNGVFHTVNGHYKIIVKHPTPVYWEITEMPEVMANPMFRKPGANITFIIGMIAGVTYEGPYATKGEGLRYQCNAISNTGSYPFIPTNADWFEVNCRTAVLTSIGVPTPEIIKGKYKIWACTRTANPKGNEMKVLWDDTITLPFRIKASVIIDLKKTESQLEAEGYKTYLAPAMNHGSYVGTYLGSVDLKETKRHRITFLGITNSANIRTSYIDMIHFIPVDMDQIWPKFNQAGQMVTREMAGVQ